MVKKKEFIATALKYNPEEQVAPKVIAKGAGYVADAILKKVKKTTYLSTKMKNCLNSFIICLLGKKYQKNFMN